jgi:methylenetetrahydrofolate reductase (NADPH)
MSKPITSLQERIASGRPLLIAEMSPPQSADPVRMREIAKRYAGKVNALGVSDNRDRVSMGSLSAAVIAAGEGVEPILHMTTRDRNRIALVSEALGAQALGIRNVLCTSGSHQTLGQFRAAKNVYDIDSIQLLQMYGKLGSDCGPIGEGGIEGAGPFCLGAVASPDADPLEFQVSRLQKKAAAGATFLITQPIFDLERFDAWWKELTRRGIHKQIAIVAGIHALGQEELAAAKEGKRRPYRVPDSLVEQVASKGNSDAQRSAAIEIAVETIGKLSRCEGLRGFSVCGDGDDEAALKIIEKSGLGSK